MTPPTLIRPMLAQRFQPRWWTSEGMFVQPKLNGVRCLYHRGRFMSRDGVAWRETNLRRLRSALEDLGDIMLDGELYQHGLSLQAINSRVAVVRTEPHPSEDEVCYWVFDIISADPFYMRAAALAELAQRFPEPPVIITPTHFRPTLADAEQQFLHWKNLRYEGAIYRMPRAPYSFPSTCTNKQNRVRYIMKRKDWLDLDAVVLHVEEGAGRLLGTCGAICLRAPNGSVFSAGTGLSDVQREWCWQHRNKLPGYTVKIKFEMFSDNAVPLKPSIILLPTLV